MFHICHPTVQDFSFMAFLLFCKKYIRFSLSRNSSDAVTLLLSVSVFLFLFLSIYQTIKVAEEKAKKEKKHE